MGRASKSSMLVGGGVQAVLVLAMASVHCTSSSGGGGAGEGPDGEVAIDSGVVGDAFVPSDGASDATTVDSGHLSMDAATDTGTSGSTDATTDTGTSGSTDASPDVLPVPDGSILNPCQLPGSVQFTAAGTVTVAGGGASWPSLAFLKLPVGFCAHYYGTVGNARQMRFAPGGELFVASPTTGTTGGGANGQSAIMVLPDDNLDGVADGNLTYLAGLPSTQGMLFAPGFFYYQNGVQIMRTAYASGQRTYAGPSTTVANITYYSDALHWPKTLDMADDGTIFVANGGSQSDPCVQSGSPPTHPFLGGIRKIDPTGTNMDGIPIAQGFRNPINIRCAAGHDQCFAIELALDYSYTSGGREKLVPIRPNQSPIDDWGFPCCATRGVPNLSSPAGTDCSGVSQETNSFEIGDTPFGMDFERGYWPGTWNRRLYVVTHGAAGSWYGARMVSIPLDPSTGLPLASTDLGDGGGEVDGPDVGMVDFATGWDDGKQDHGRPAAVTFGPDGRLYVANDNNGVIFWIAPM